MSLSALNAQPVDKVNAFNVATSDDGYTKFHRIDTCSAYFEGTTQVARCREGEVPTPAATWLFLLILIAFVGLSNKRRL